MSKDNVTAVLQLMRIPGSINTKEDQTVQEDCI